MLEMSCSVCVLCGLPASGKSSIAKQLIKSSSTSPKFIHVCYDSIMPHVSHISDTVNAWKAARLIIVKNILNLVGYITDKYEALDGPFKDENLVTEELEALFQKVVESARDRHLVFLVDDNMQYRGMRHEYYNISSKYQIGFGTIYFKCPLEVCLDRNRKREANVPESVIKKIWGQFETPGKLNWEKNHLILDSSGSTSEEDILNCILSFIETIERNPLCVKELDPGNDVEKTRIANRDNFIHQVDLCSRKFISGRMKQLKNRGETVEQLQVKSRTFNEERKQMLQLLKLGYMDETEFHDENGTLNIAMIQDKISNMIKMW